MKWKHWVNQLFCCLPFLFPSFSFPSVKEKRHAAPPSRLPRQRKKLLLLAGSSGRRERNFACFPFLLLWFLGCNGCNEKVNNKSSLKLSKLIKMKNLIDRLEDMVIMLHLKPIPKTRKKNSMSFTFFLQNCSDSLQTKRRHSRKRGARTSFFCRQGHYIIQTWRSFFATAILSFLWAL